MQRRQINAHKFGFTPLSLSPALWLSDTGSDPSVWPDLSGNGRDAVQATGSSQFSIVTSALNGRQVRRSDGADDFMVSTFTLAQPMTIFSVWKCSADDTFQYCYDGIDGSNRAALIAYVSGSGNANVAFAGVELFGGTRTASPTLHCIEFNGASSAIYKNGSSAASGNAGTQGINGLTLGRRNTNENHLVGDLAEIIVFPSVLATGDRQAVEEFLNEKYALY